MTIIFGEWLREKLDQQGIRPIELARRSKIDPGSLSRYLSGEREPTAQNLQAIAKGLHISHEEVFRAAGIFPVKPAHDEKTERGRYLLENYKSPATKERALEYLEFLRLQEERGEYAAKPGSKPKKSEKNHEESLKKALGD